MKNHKILYRIKLAENEYKNLKDELQKHPILQSKKDTYLKIDQVSFLEIWKQYMTLFSDLQSLVFASRYRKYFIFLDYNKMVIRKYVLVLYFNIIMEIDDIFWEHSSYIRTLLHDNFTKDYWYYWKYIYKPKYVAIINMPNLFFRAFDHKLKREVRDLLQPWIIQTHNKIRLTADYNNLFYYLKFRYDACMYHIMKCVGNIISRTRFSSRTKGYITSENLNTYLDLAKPGDIMLTRWNWNATNIWIPWFWKHMSMYLGSGKYLKKHYPSQHTKKLDDAKHYLIESTGEWVQIVDMKCIAEKNDYLGVSRTNFSKEKINRVIKNSFDYIWVWYDYIFNFYSNKSLVCSELVMKSYARESVWDLWIDIDLDHVWSGLVFPPNNFIDVLIREDSFKKPCVEPLFFIDSIEKNGENFISTKEALLLSWKRARLSLFLK